MERTTEVSESNDAKALTALTQWVKRTPQRTPQNTDSEESRAEPKSSQEGNDTAELQPGRVARVETNTGEERNQQNGKMKNVKITENQNKEI
jgi:hypothetical protein